MKKRPFYEKFLPYLLFVFIGYCVSDILILSFRDQMLPKQPPLARPKAQGYDARPEKAVYSVIKNRNIFDSEGKIPDALRGADDPKQNVKDQPPVASNLPLTIQGTIVHSNPAKSIANIEIKSKNSVIPFHVGQDIEGIAILLEVERGKIIIRNKNNDRKEFLEMKLTGAKIGFSAAKTADKPAGDVVQTAPNNFEIKKTDLNRYLSDLSGILQQAATAPRRNVNGEIECFKFLAIQPGSIYTQLGFQNGDCIKAVNGEKVDSPAKAMEMYQAMRNSPTIKLQFERDGRDTESNYNVK